MKTYKGFDKDLKCRGFEYEIGKTYEHDGPVKACESGFHGCEYPLDVFGYYAPSNSSFAIVEQDGEIARRAEDSKIASSKITICDSIDFPGLVKAAIEYTRLRCKAVDPVSPAFSDKPYGAASSTGYQGAASSTGYQGAASSTGAHSVAIACGAESRVMGAESAAIVLVYRNPETGAIVHIRASKVGENGIKPGVWYSLNSNGDFVET